MKFLLYPPKDIQNRPMKQPEQANMNTGHRERVQERFLNMPDKELMADYEFLELVLMRAIPRMDVKPLAKELLKKYNSVAAVLTAPEEELTTFKYIKKSTVALFQIIVEANKRLLKTELKENPVLDKWDRLIDYCCLCLQNERIEHFMVLYLDTRLRLIQRDIPQDGTTDRVSIYPREILKKALNLGASSVVIVHNHPSEQVQPSPADIAMTGELYKTLMAGNIRFLDHLIIGSGRKVYSFSAHGQLVGKSK